MARLILAMVTSLGLSAAAAAQPSTPFPAATPQSVGVDPAALRELSAAAKSVVDNDEAVGAELLVVKDHHTVLHEVFGLKDRESNTPMQKDTIFCIRSMTKPVAGTAIQMLIDEGRVALPDRAEKFLPVFKDTACAPITVEQLLTHRAGLPLSLINRPLGDYRSRDDIVQQIAEQGPMFDIGKQFSYSDCGADTLGAIVDHASGATLEDFVQRRILDPLGMHDTLTVVKTDDPRRARISSNYMGQAKAWSRFWGPDDPALFPFLFASQSLYSTPADYARFMALWLDGGVADGKRLLSEAAIKRALTPASNGDTLPAGFESVKPKYGQLWTLYTNPDHDDDLLVFSHGGSDGTGAWAFPKDHLIVCYFIQARGSDSALKIDAILDKWFVAPRLGTKPAAAAPPPTPADLDRLCGLYWANEEGMYRMVARDKDRLTVEIPGRAIAKLKSRDDGRWAVEGAPGQTVSFEVGPDGAPVALIGAAAEASQRMPRHTPPADLPSVDEIVRLHLAGHHSADLAEMPPFRRTGTIDLPQRHLKGTTSSLIAPKHRFRIEVDLGAIQQIVVTNGDRGWNAATGQAVMDLAGPVAEQQGLDHPAVLFGDFRPYYQDITVVGRSEIDGEPVYVLRAVPREAPPTALLISVKSGLLLGQERLVILPALGTLGVSIRYNDVRDVGGVRLPFRITAQYPTPLLGTTTIQFDRVDLSPEVPDHAFDRPEPIPLNPPKPPPEPPQPPK